MKGSERARIAAETISILEQGSYLSRQGRVEITPSLAACIEGTELVTPSDFDSIRSSLTSVGADSSPRVQPSISITAETTLEAAQRLVVQQGLENVGCLNFASAKNPGGGFRGGAQAQEESLARASGLYFSLLQAGSFYDFHRAQRDLLYSHHMIYSPEVPVFRSDDGALLDQPFAVSMITSPAVNVGAIEANRPRDLDQVLPIMEERAARVLWLAAGRGWEHVILGAWGCGVFRNDPRQVARIFSEVIAEGLLEHRFRSIVFAIPGTSSDRNRIAFEEFFTSG